MAKVRVRSDSHGLFFRAKGSVYRPQVAKGQRGADTRTTLVDGDEIETAVMTGFPIAHVHRGRVIELWYNHGEYLTKPPGFIDTNQLWNPA